MRPLGGSGLPGDCARRARFQARAAALGLCVALPLACNWQDGPAGGSPVRSITLSVQNPQILVGEQTKVTAVLRDAGGNVVPDLQPEWRSLTPTIVGVSAAGDVTGLLAGTGQVRASSGSGASVATIIVTNPPAANLSLGRDSATLLLPGGSVQAIAAATDATGRAIVNPNITWTSSSAQIASVNVAGLVTAMASGTAIISARIDALTANMTVTVRPAVVPDAPVVTSISPAVLQPGGAYTLTGANFGATPAANQVLVDGLAATVQAASPTQLTVVLPTAGFICEPARDAFLQVTAGGKIGGRTAPLQTANRRALAPGEAAIVTNLAEVRCNELVPADGRWVVTAYNVERNPVTPTQQGGVAFAILGTPGSPVAVPTAGATGAHGRPAGAPIAPLASISVSAFTRRADSGRATTVAHLSLLERNRTILSAAARSAVGPRGAIANVPPPSRVLTTVGSITTLKVPNLDAADFCVSNTPLGFRTVYAGPHVVIVEDTTTVFNGLPTQKGQVDSYYVRIGDEFESAMWPILTTNFGNPLAMDAQLGGVGRVVMVFSPRVNVMQRGSLLGFVATCDFFPVSQRPSSNLGAFFYAAVPTSSATGYAAPDTRDQWLRDLRSTVIHEVKHLASNAERLSRGFAVEDLSWEEGGARIAEELYARGLYGSTVRSNTGYTQSVSCDIQYDQPTSPCADRPVLMLRHFDALYLFMAGPELSTPLGRPLAGDATFYAGAWSFLRWAADHYAPAEQLFFRDIVASPATGVANLEARTGRRWEEMLGEWSLAAYLDDIGGFTPANPRLAMPSWNYPGMWLGMCVDMGPCVDPSNPILLYPRSTPFSPRARSFGDFQVVIGQMVGGGFTLLDLSGPGSSSQVIEIKALAGSGDAPPTVRVAFARVR